MKITSAIASHYRAVYFGGNWTVSNLRDTLQDITWQQAILKPEGYNSIVALVYHIHYFSKALLQVLEENQLTANDKYSFDHPEINSAEEWKQFQEAIFLEAEKLAVLINNLPDEILFQNFVQEKYGNYYRNLHGIIEHAHYHLGQIVIIKKLIK
jgi:hypothetical protein